MSTNLECLFVEKDKGKWFYILENWDAPKNAWDWKEYSTAYGSFSSFDIAKKHLDENHANPGGYSVIASKFYNALSNSKRAIYEDLFKHAIKI